MPTTIADLYALEPWWETNAVGQEVLKGAYYDHMPEWLTSGEWDGLPRGNTGSAYPDGSPARLQPNELVAARCVLEQSEDARRYWRVMVIAYHDRPFMVCCNAGREGDDYARRYVTSRGLYDQAVSYLNGLRIANDDTERVSLNFDGAELLDFYGHAFHPAEIQHRAAEQQGAA